MGIRRLKWFVFMDCPDGGVAPIIDFWTKRAARRWVNLAELHSPERQFSVHRYGWKP